MNDDASHPHELLGVREQDVNAIRRKRRVEILCRPLIALLSVLGGFMLGLMSVRAFDWPLSTYPYAAPLVAGGTWRSGRAGGKRGVFLIMVISAVLGFLIGAIAGHHPADSSFGASVEYGVYASK